MFFKISHCADSRFTEHHQLDKLILSVDAGWQTVQHDQTRYVFKGYVESQPWSIDLLQTLDDHDKLGNFCVFKFCIDTSDLTLITNKWRGIIIWQQPGQWISNLDKGIHTIWNDTSIVIDQHLDLVERKLDIIGNVQDTSLDQIQAIELIHARLDQRVADFISTNKLPLRVFCSGGIDSTLVWSFIKRHSESYELVLEDRIQWDYFWCQNQRYITETFWAYRQMHHWLEPCVLSSGAPGDEFFLRSPCTVNLWLMYNDIDIFDALRSNVGIHYDYFMLSKHQKLFREQHNDKKLQYIMRMPKINFIRYLCNIVINDCQHWHLGNTLTFTPLRDLEVFKLLLSLPPDELMPQIFDSEISRKLIGKNDHALLEVLSPVKNVNESLVNLCHLVPK